MTSSFGFCIIITNNQPIEINYINTIPLLCNFRNKMQLIKSGYFSNIAYLLHAKSTYSILF